MPVTVKKVMEYSEYDVIRRVIMKYMPWSVSLINYDKTISLGVFNFVDSRYVPEFMKSSILPFNTDLMNTVNIEMETKLIELGVPAFNLLDHSISIEISEDAVHPNCVDISAKCATCGAETVIEINPEEIEYKVY